MQSSGMKTRKPIPTTAASELIFERAGKETQGFP